MRFDEVELEAVPLGAEEPEAAAPEQAAPRGKRLLALFADLSLFAALALALSPLIPQPHSWIHVAALAGFVVVMSYYYFVGSWMLWGKTIGGTIFDVRVIAADGAMSLRAATLRWVALHVSLWTAGIGFLLAALPAQLSLADRVSDTRCVSS